MKRIDRYVLFAFLKNYLLSFAVLVGLFIVMDMVFNFDEFTKSSGETTPLEIVGAIASYYFHQGFLVYSQLAGIIPVLAAAFTLMRMSRFNELTALLAAGVPMLRVAAPVILMAVGINLVVQPINQELVIPAIAREIVRDRDEALESADRSFPVRAMPDGRGGIFDAALFHPASAGEAAWVETLTVVERGPTGEIERLIVADVGTWDAASAEWVLTDGRVVDDLDTGAGRPAAPSILEIGDGLGTGDPHQAIDRLRTPVSPAEIELFRSANGSVGAGGSYFDLLSTSQINQLLARPEQYATVSLLRAKHTRLASHAMNVVLMLLAIPAVLTRQPGQLRQAATRTLLLVGAAMGTVFLCQLLAKEPPSGALAARWPALMAWMPVFLFGPLAVLLLDRIET